MYRIWARRIFNLVWAALSKRSEMVSLDVGSVISAEERRNGAVG